MSETRPVPRRESPWGLPEGHREPKAHRCNDRVEDVVQVLTISMFNIGFRFRFFFFSFLIINLSLDLSLISGISCYFVFVMSNKLVVSEIQCNQFRVFLGFCYFIIIAQGTRNVG